MTGVDVGLTARCNSVRKRIPFAYWLALDAVVFPLLVWGLVSTSPLYAVGLAMVGVAVFFDVSEAIVKWSLRGAEGISPSTASTDATSDGAAGSPEEKP